MEIDDEQADADTADMATSQAGMRLQTCSRFINCCGGLLESHYRVLAVPSDVIQLPNDDEDEPPKNARGSGRASSISRGLSKRMPSSRTSHPPTEPVVQELGGSSQIGVSFVVPLSTAQPPVTAAQTAGPTSSLKH